MKQFVHGCTLAVPETWARLFLPCRTSGVLSEAARLVSGAQQIAPVTSVLRSEAENPSHVAEESIVRILPMRTSMLPVVCDLHREAMANAPSARLGDRYLRAFLSWFLNRKDAIALIAEMEPGGVVGYVIGAPVGYTASLNRDLAWVGATSVMMRPWLLSDVRICSTLRARLAFVFGGSASHATGLPSPAMSLVGIAVAPSAVGKGFGFALMKAFEDRARALQMASLRLSVYPDNAPARRLYERCGWRPLPHSQSSTGTIYYGLVILRHHRA